MYVIKQQKPRKPIQYTPTMMNVSPLVDNPLRI
jgi:hypothetical protein